MQPWNAAGNDAAGNGIPRPLPVADAARALQDIAAERPMEAAPAAFVASRLAALSAAPGSGGEARRAARRGPVLWVQDRASRRESGRLYETGLRRAFRIEGPILLVRVSHPRDALRAMEEGAACAALAAVVGEVDGSATVLDMTATQRLALRARVSGVPVWLLRGPSAGGLSAARLRWRLGSRPSAAHPHDPAAPGAPAWSAELVRAAGEAPGRWEIVHDGGGERTGAGPGGAPDRLGLVPLSGDRPLAPPGGAEPLAAAG